MISRCFPHFWSWPWDLNLSHRSYFRTHLSLYQSLYDRGTYSSTLWKRGKFYPFAEKLMKVVTVMRSLWFIKFVLSTLVKTMSQTTKVQSFSLNNFGKILRSQRVVDEIAGNLSKPIHGLQTHSKLQTACEMLQKWTAFTPGLSESAQVSRGWSGGNEIGERGKQNREKVYKTENTKSGDGALCRI